MNPIKPINDQTGPAIKEVFNTPPLKILLSIVRSRASRAIRDPQPLPSYQDTLLVSEYLIFLFAPLTIMHYSRECHIIRYQIKGICRNKTTQKKEPSRQIWFFWWFRLKLTDWIKSRAIRRSIRVNSKLKWESYINKNKF